VLECKWSVVSRKTLDEFLEVLKWSTDFGVDTENGRGLKNGVVPVFAAGTYNPKETVAVSAEKITLAQYASRLNIKLLRPADFNEKLRVYGVDKRFTVQKICKIAMDEKQMRELLDEAWSQPKTMQEILTEISIKNESVFEFEQALVS
jgi:hypothetical protein